MPIATAHQRQFHNQKADRELPLRQAALSAFKKEDHVAWMGDYLGQVAGFSQERGRVLIKGKKGDFDPRELKLADPPDKK